MTVHARRGRQGDGCAKEEGGRSNETTSGSDVLDSCSCSGSRSRPPAAAGASGSATTDGSAAQRRRHLAETARRRPSTGARPTPAPPRRPDEFGETYDADPAVIEKALFDASLLPSDPAAQQVALAAFARADDPVDQDLALECWKNNGCDTGTGGELTAAYVEPFGENVYREMSKMEFILQALTYPEIGKIIYTSSNGVHRARPGDPLADFRSAIAQGADVIVNYPGHRRRLPAGVQGGDGARESRSARTPGAT